MKIKTYKKGNNINTIIKYNKKDNIKEILYNELSFFINKLSLPKVYQVFIIGIGNDSHTADSVGPKTLKYINSNTQLMHKGITPPNIKISSLEPGVLSETGIDTSKIIKSVSKEIKPNLIILIDSITSDNINDLNNTIKITNFGLIPGSGINSFNEEINSKTLNKPIISIGITTAIKIEQNHNSYLLSTSDIDIYVNSISKIIATVLNELFN